MPPNDLNTAESHPLRVPPMAEAVFALGYRFASESAVPGFASDGERAAWVPYEPGISSRNLLFDLKANRFAILLRGEPGAVIVPHYHTSPVVGYCVQGTWHYREHDWVARPGSFVYEPSGEAHTLEILGDETMYTFFYVQGPHISLDDEGRQIGYLDAFRMLEYCRHHYRENGHDLAYLDSITIR